MVPGVSTGSSGCSGSGSGSGSGSPKILTAEPYPTVLPLDGDTSTTISPFCVPSTSSGIRLSPLRMFATSPAVFPMRLDGTVTSVYLYHNRHVGSLFLLSLQCLSECFAQQLYHSALHFLWAASSQYRSSVRPLPEAPALLFLSFRSMSSGTSEITNFRSF